MESHTITEAMGEYARDNLETCLSHMNGAGQGRLEVCHI